MTRVGGIFEKEEIDMEALQLMSEEDLIMLGLPLGSARKIANGNGVFCVATSLQAPPRPPLRNDPSSPPPSAVVICAVLWPVSRRAQGAGVPADFSQRADASP